MNLEEKFVFEVVKNANGDIRKSINDLQFYSGSKCYFVSPTSEVSEFNSNTLSEIDEIVGTCERIRGLLPGFWTSKISNNLDFGNDSDGKERRKKTEIEMSVFPAESFDDEIIKNLKITVERKTPESFKIFEDNSRSQSLELKESRSLEAAVPLAVFDCLFRKSVPSKPMTIAMDEIFVLQKIDEVFKKNKTEGRRRALHPFAAVDHDIGCSLDQADRLRGSIVSYSNWPDHGVETENPCEMEH